MDCPDHSAYDYRSLSLLAASDRLQHGTKVIEPAMQEGLIVISDRYFYSCLANLHARGFEKDEWIYKIAESVVRPDIAFFFDVPVEIAVQRVRSRPEEKDRYITDILIWIYSISSVTNISKFVKQITVCLFLRIFRLRKATLL